MSISPLATYRVQLHASFGFDAVAALADYLHELGVSHLYASPYLQANPGSTHGYDILDHGRVSDDIGGPDAHVRLCEQLARFGLGQILDIVPNHMSISNRDNLWWWDVLENGQSSQYAYFFDVDWEPLEQKLHERVLLPILGDHYGRVVDAGEIRLERTEGSFTFHYHDHVMPVAPRSLSELLERAARRCDSPDLAFIADSFGNLPHSSAKDWPSVTRRHRDKEVLRRQLARLCTENSEIASSIEQMIDELNSSPNEIDALLERQNYRLAYWRSAGQELDYRRFFDINTLISVRIEDERVFQATNALVFKWVQQGVLDGLRVDHPDGLRDPTQYFQRLRQAVPNGWIVAEKILEPGEDLPEEWPVSGTTGYDFLNRVGTLMIDPTGEDPLSQIYSEFTGIPVDYLEMVHQKKHYVLKKLFASDINRLTSLLIKVCERQKRYRDYSRRELNAMLREVIACFPVYRTYVQAETGRVTTRDATRIHQAIEAAKVLRPEIDTDLLDFFRDLLLLKVRGTLESELVMQFQQHTGPVMAKGVEDTVFYNFNRLVCLNEVGGDPGRFSLSLEEFHEECRASVEKWPQSMLTTTTHDTKRSEDVRARLALLAEIPEEWARITTRWAERHEAYKVEGFPDRNIEYLLYQTLVGAWPLEQERAQSYILKVAREAKAYTSWTDPDPDYESALEGFTSALYQDEVFTNELAELAKKLVEPGRCNSLAMLLIKLTAPGVPDLYQGNELWDLSLVDPDNRRPVDYDLRRKLLAELRTLPLEGIVARADEGFPKLWLTRQALSVRKTRPEVFGHWSTYEPLQATGEKSDHVIAFSRSGKVISIAPRWPIRLNNRWDDTRLEVPTGHWHNELTGEIFKGPSIELGSLLKKFPVALLSLKDD